jgi:hypothetical protein
MRLRTSTVVLLGAALVSCVGPADEVGVAPVPILDVASPPALEIGVVDGDSAFLFQSIVSTLSLPSGNIVVADAGGSELVMYGPTGAFVRRWGGRGEGPGEFRNLARLYPLGPDSLMALDSWTDRLSVFDTAGTFGRQLAVAEIAADTLFTMDVWLYGRFWVDGALGEARRAQVRRALDGLPPPRTGPGYRVVRVAPDGGLWIREPEVDGEGRRTWTVTDPSGTPHSLVRVPVRFDPLALDGRRLLGRWLGESDVHFVRGYDLVDSGRQAPPPAWMTAGKADSPTIAPDQEAFMDQIRTSFRDMARAQEIHYSTEMTYTARLDSLDWDQPSEVNVDVVNAGPRGWVAVFTHPGLDRICGLGYGFTVPPGWAPGGVLCGPAAPTPRQGVA